MVQGRTSLNLSVNIAVVQLFVENQEYFRVYKETISDNKSNIDKPCRGLPAPTTVLTFSSSGQNLSR